MDSSIGLIVLLIYGLFAFAMTYWYSRGYNDNKTSFSIPLRIMRGNKSRDSYLNDFKILSDWPWVYQYYQFESPIKYDEIKQIAIDPSSRLADINPQNNVWGNNKLKQQSPIIYMNTN